jgi:D-alanyl-D-alanine carboxypeptidase
VNAHLSKVRFFGLRWPFHERAELPLQKVVERLSEIIKRDSSVRRFVDPIGGTFTWRKIKRTKALSAHSFGIAIDLNPTLSHYWRWKPKGEAWVWRNKIPQSVVDAFEAEGFIWGGRWQHFDTMHFEYRPELLSPNCHD